MTKKIFARLVAILMIFTLVACGNEKTPANNTNTTEGEGGKILVAYYSATGNTKKVAEYIAKETGGDLFEISPVDPYTADDLNWRKDGSRVNVEHEDESKRDIPLVKSTPDNFSEYNTVYIGYPIWWAIAAWPIDNFVKNNDFTGKTVIPFCTSTDSGLGKSDELLKEMAGEGNWLEGKRFHSGVSEKDVIEWVKSNSRETLSTPNADTELKHFPKKLIEVPKTYYGEAEQKGVLEDLYYDTYESFTYKEKTQKLQKHAVVYLPYDYDETKEYPVFYLMHGGWSNEYTYLGSVDKPHGIKNILDHGIQNGEIKPMIVVCPTYNNTSPEDSGDYGLALQLTDNYHNELENDLIPAVDSKYSTIADRDYRAFCGFSMGSMATWRTFEHSLEYFRYFMPSSGGPALSASTYADIVKQSGYSPNDFFIFAASGTNDFAYSGFKRGIDSMKADGQTFLFADNESEGNLYYLESDGDHSGQYAMLYFYNGLRFIWQ